MKYCFQLAALISFFLLITACPQPMDGTDSSGSSDSGNNSTNRDSTLSFTIYDADTKLPLTNSFIEVVGNSAQEVIPDATHDITVSPGEYNIAIEKAGYIPRTLSLKAAGNRDIKIFLHEKINPEPVNWGGQVSGTFTVDNAVYTNSYFISKYSEGETLVMDVPGNNGGEFVFGNKIGDLSLSAFTKTPGGLIDKITYKSTLTLPHSGMLQDVNLNFDTAASPVYSGKLQAGSSLEVKLSNSFSIARQAAGPSNYHFSLDKENNSDNVFLESVFYTESRTDFSRIRLIDTDREYDFPSPLPAPDYAITKEGDYYNVNVTTNSQFSYYTAYVLEITNGTASVSFEAKMYKSSLVKIPAALINPGAQTKMLFLCGVKVENFREDDFFNGTTPAASIFYCETGSELPTEGPAGQTDYNYRKEKKRTGYLVLD